MIRYQILCALLFSGTCANAQLALARDTISVLENNYVLKMPWANGINYANVSMTDLNGDGKKDIVVFDRQNQFGSGRFRCFVNVGAAGQVKYVADPGLSYLFPPCSNWAVFHDYNCDGKEDLFCSTTAGIKVFKNLSNTLPNFSLAKSLLYSSYSPGGTQPEANLYASPVGVPGFGDIDNDGDLDILTFSPQGIFIEYHKSVGLDNYGTCDSLRFKIGDVCWGNISESNCYVSFKACHARMAWDSLAPDPNKVYHAGSCLMCLDSDNDGDKDLVMGDISCNTLHYVHNSGSTLTADFVDSTSMYPNYPAINNTTRIKMNNFPCTYNVDIDNNGKKDLVASPNSFGSENTKSMWYYRNASATSTVNFQFVKNNFLQDEMIEVGQNSFPVIFDHNADGKKDLLIGTYGYYQNTSLSAKLTLYENVGSKAIPVYSLITRDYANVSSKNLNNVMPAVGDIDGDNDVDICLGTSSGQIHWLENTAGPGNVCNFSVFKNNPFSFTTTSAAAAPQLFDLDADGKLDLLIGGKNGRVAFYKNIGTATVPSFTLITDSVGKVSTKGNPNLFGLDGYATPFFFNDNGQTKLLVGSVSGGISLYSVPSATAVFNLISGSVNGLNEGGQSTAFYEDVNDDNKPDLFVGNASGGLSFFSSKSVEVGLSETVSSIAAAIFIFPNPNKGFVNLGIDGVEFEKGSYGITDLPGNLLMSDFFSHNNEAIDLSLFSPGVYFITIQINANHQSYRVTKKIIKE